MLGAKSDWFLFLFACLLCTLVFLLSTNSIIFFKGREKEERQETNIFLLIKTYSSSKKTTTRNSEAENKWWAFFCGIQLYERQRSKHKKRNINKLNAAYNVTRYLISMRKDKLILEVLCCGLCVVFCSAEGENNKRRNKMNSNRTLKQSYDHINSILIAE